MDELGDYSYIYIIIENIVKFRADGTVLLQSRGLYHRNHHKGKETLIRLDLTQPSLILEKYTYLGIPLSENF